MEQAEAPRDDGNSDLNPQESVQVVGEEQLGDGTDQGIIGILSSTGLRRTSKMATRGSIRGSTCSGTRPRRGGAPMETPGEAGFREMARGSENRACPSAMLLERPSQTCCGITSRANHSMRARNSSRLLCAKPT